MVYPLFVTILTVTKRLTTEWHMLAVVNLFLKEVARDIFAQNIALSQGSMVGMKFVSTQVLNVNASGRKFVNDALKVNHHLISRQNTPTGQNMYSKIKAGRSGAKKINQKYSD